MEENNNNENIEPINLEEFETTDLKTNDSTNTENKNITNILCIISLCLHYGSGIITAILSRLLNTAPDFISKLFMSLLSLSGLASWVLMIIARVKNPKSTFGKVLMWLYIIELILTIIAIIILIVACANIISGIANSDLPSQISNMISGCANIG